MGLRFFSKQMLDAHLFSFFRARSCSFIFSRTGATLSAVHLFRAGKKKANAALYPFSS
jgi:hypothetical protein